MAAFNRMRQKMQAMFQRLSNGPVEQRSLKDQQALPGLLDALYDRDEGVRFAAVQALEGLNWQGNRSEAEAIYRIYQGDWQRCTQIGAPAVRPLLDVLRRRQSRQQMDAARAALVALRDPAAVRLLLAVLDEDVDVYEVQEAALRALAAYADPRATASVLRLLASPHRAVQEAAAGALDALGWQPDRSEAAALYYLVKGDWQACARVGPQALRPLQAALKAYVPETRRAAVRALGSLGSAEVLPQLLALLRDSDAGVQAAVVQALDELHWQPDHSEAAALYFWLKQDWVRCVQVGPSAVQLLLNALDDPREEVRQEAAWGLRELGWSFERINRYRRAVRYRTLGEDGLVEEILSTHQRNLNAEWRLNMQRVGEFLLDEGGLDAMKRVQRQVSSRSGGVGYDLSRAWDGLGGWRS